jgi:hypothetical protein
MTAVRRREVAHSSGLQQVADSRSRKRALPVHLSWCADARHAIAWSSRNVKSTVQRSSRRRRQPPRQLVQIRRRPTPPRSQHRWRAPLQSPLMRSATVPVRSRQSSSSSRFSLARPSQQYARMGREKYDVARNHRFSGRAAPGDRASPGPCRCGNIWRSPRQRWDCRRLRRTASSTSGTSCRQVSPVSRGLACP